MRPGSGTARFARKPAPVWVELPRTCGQARDSACPATSGQAQNRLRRPLRISAARPPAHLHDRSPPVYEDCTVSRRWLRFAYLVPGAAGLAVLQVETAVRGDLLTTRSLELGRAVDDLCRGSQSR